MTDQRQRSVLCLLLCCLGLLGFGAQADEVQVSVMQSPAGTASALSRLTSDAKGDLYLSWVDTEDKGHSLYYSRLTQQKWGAPQMISQGDDWFVNWADFPFLSVNDSGMTAHWLAKSAEATYDYNIKATFYDAKAERWSKAVTIHDDGVSAEHGFVSMLAMSSGRTFISWLDGRNTVKAASDDQNEAHDEGHSMRGGMTLRAGVFDGDGKTLNDWELDDLTCDCCQTSSAMTDNGPVVVYRDRTDDEIRDVYITRWFDDKWTEPVPVYEDQWQIAGCPVNGPAVAAKGQMAAVAWFSAKNDKPKVSLAISQDNGVSFAAPVNVADKATNGRVSIAILKSGDIAVSWLATDGAAAELRLSLYNARAELLANIKVADTKASRRSGFPVITSQDDTVYVTWTDLEGEGQVRVAKVIF